MFSQKGKFNNIRAVVVRSDQNLSSVSNSSTLTSSSRKYLIEGKTPEEVIQIAVAQGDRLIVNLLLDPAPMNADEIKLRCAYHHFFEKKLCFERRLEIRTLQLSVIKDYYSLYDTDILNHLEEIIPTLKQKLFNLFHSMRQKNIEHLKNTTDIFLEDSIIKLNTRLRVKLHKQFSNQLEKDFTNMDFKITTSSLEDGLSIYDQLVKDYYVIKNDLSLLLKKDEILLKQIHELEKARITAKENHAHEKNQILSKLFMDKSIIHSKLKETKQLTNIVKKQVSVDYVDASTGNNLIHTACSQGQFEMALFLMKKGVDGKFKNLASIPAIDMPNANGNTLVHFLLTRGKFSLAANLLSEVAKGNIKNSKEQTALDVNTKEHSLIHYLLEKINDTNCSKQNEYNLLRHLFFQNLSLSPLLIKNKNNKTAYTIILNSIDQILKEVLFDILKKGNLEKSFTSLFQADINYGLWQHFDFLSAQHSYSWLTKKIQGVDEIYLETQLTFLNNLQKKLQEACEKRNDGILVNFLSEAFKNEKLISNCQKFYRVYVQTLMEQKSLAKYQDIRANKYFIEPNEFPSKKYISSYLLMTDNGLVDLLPKKLTENIPSPDAGHIQTFRSPLQQRLEILRKIQEKCSDPLQWFEKYPRKSFKK